MARQKQNKSSNAIATRPAPVRAEVQALFDKQSGQLSAALAGQLDTDRFVRAAMTAWSTGSSAFRKSDPVSLLGACMQAAQLGLSVDPILGEAWLIPRRNRNRGGEFCINFQLGVKGLVKLARRSGNFRNVRAEIVSDGDYFEYAEGSEIEIRHKKQLDAKARPGLRCTYATVFYKSGGSSSYVAPMFEILEARDRSDAYRNGGGPWIDHFESMAMVVALRKLMRLESIDEPTLRQIGREEAQEASVDVIEYDISGEPVAAGDARPAIDAPPPASVGELKNQFGPPPDEGTPFDDDPDPEPRKV